FQVRMYRFGQALERLQQTAQVTGAAEVTRIGDALKQIAAESSSLPIGAVILVSDGADNSGGIDRQTIAEVRRSRIPVHTVGIGREAPSRDLEISDVVMPARTLADSRIGAQVTLRQFGYQDRRVRLTISDGGKPLASQEVTLKRSGEPQTESILFSAGVAGAKTLTVSVDRLDGEENQNNNSVARLVNVEALRPRVLYIEGDPRWELKFMRRALDEDRSVQLVSMLRTTQNKIYRQGIADPKELENGFPGTAEELFRYQGLILGNVEAAYFTPAQQELIRQFVDRRGGGLLFLGGRAALADGGYGASVLADLVPVVLPERKTTFHREPAKATLTAAGRDSLICRLIEQPDKNAERWEKLPALADYQEVGEPKPAALVLAEAQTAGRARYPLLVTQNYGMGKTALFATGGSWKWRMLQDHTDTTHQTFWQQMLRWLVADAARTCSVSTPHQMLFDEGRVPLRAVVREKTFQAASDARVEAHILGPEGVSASLELSPSATEAGQYEGEYMAEKPGSYLVEVTATRGAEEVGRDVLTFRRENGVAENFRTEQNRELLEKLAEETGGRYYTPDKVGRLSEEVSYSEAGITTRELRDLWDMPAVFLLLLLLRGAEWLLRRRWGGV
ncbi:MAG: glutamine amidotransferase, partial [Bryobacteraceae bacterium]